MLKTRENWLRVAIGMLVASMMLSFFATVAHAQGQAGLSVAPPNTDMTVSPGETVTRTLTISNEGTSSVDVTMTANNFTASGEEGGSSYLPRGRGSLADWMTLNPSSFTLAGGSAKDVSVTMSVPSNASAGGHYATVFAYTAASGDVSGSGASVTTAIGANFLLNVSGQVVQRASIAEFSTPRSRVNAGEELEFTVRVSNSGNTHITPTGVIEVFRKGVKVGEVDINPNGSSVLPNSTRKFTVASDDAILPGAYSASATLAYGAGEVLTAPAISFAVIGDSSLITLVAGGLAALVVLLALALFVGRKKGTVR